MKEKLLQSILAATKDGTLVWILNKTIFTTEKKMDYQCVINDGSIVEVDIRLNDTLQFENCNLMLIKNPNLVDGYIKPNIVPRAKTQDDVFSDIINAIPNKQEQRDIGRRSRSRRRDVSIIYSD